MIKITMMKIMIIVLTIMQTPTHFTLVCWVEFARAWFG